MTQIPHFQMYIDGAWTEGDTGQPMATQNPAPMLAFAKLIEQAGFPAGVVSIITGVLKIAQSR